MRGPTLGEKVIDFIIYLPLTIKRLLCQHDLFTLFSAETFTKEKYERCSGSSQCKKCGANIRVYVPENNKEIDELMSCE